MNMYANMNYKNTNIFKVLADDEEYDEKLLSTETSDLEEINKLKASNLKYQKEIYPRMTELQISIMYQKRLCDSSSRCKDNLRKHLELCSSKSKCHGNFVADECKDGENGRCSHYYAIQCDEQELISYDCYIWEQKEQIKKLEENYERALAIKENRLKEYEDSLLYDSFEEFELEYWY